MKFPDAVEAEIEARDSFANGSDARGGRATRQLRSPRRRELARGLSGGLAARPCFPGAKLAGMKIVLDCANGAASKLAPQLFRSLGANVTAINNSPDGRNINADCGSLHPEAMQKRVVETGAALGVAFDGDADRALFVSASGKLVDGDGVLLAVGRT